MILSLGRHALDRHIQPSLSMRHQYITANVGVHHIMIKLDDIISITDINNIDSDGMLVVNLSDIMDRDMHHNTDEQARIINPKYLICGSKDDTTKQFALYVDNISDMVDIGQQVKATNIAINKTDILHQQLYNAPFMSLSDDIKADIIWDVSAIIGVAASYVMLHDDNDITMPFKTPIDFMCTMFDFFTDFCLTTQHSDHDVIYTDLVVGDDKRIDHTVQYYLYHDDIHRDLPDMTYYMKPRDQATIYMCALPLKKSISGSDRQLVWRIFTNDESSYEASKKLVDKIHKQFLTLFK